MRVIDAHTGLELKVGDVVPMPGPGSTPERSLRGVGTSGWYRVIAIRPGIFHASMLVESNVPEMHGRWLPLQVRWTHPNYFLQHVAFVPS